MIIMQYIKNVLRSIHVLSKQMHLHVQVPLNYSRADCIPTYLDSERHSVSHDLGFLPVPLDHTEL